MRIRGAKTEMEEAGLETEGMVESTAKLRKEMMALTGVDIMDGADQFKSTYAIMDELADKWKDLSDIQQATVIELIAGKRQGNIVSSLMENFDTARDVLQTSANSAGSAMEEHSKWSQSLEARLLKLKSTWQSLAQSFMSSDFLKSALDGVISLVDGIDGLISKFGTLPTLLGTFAAGLTLYNGKGIFEFDKDAKNIKLFGTAIGNLKGKFGAVQKQIERYNSVSSKSASFQQKYNAVLQSSDSSFARYARGLNGGQASMKGYISSLVGATVKTVGLQAATMALNAALTMGIAAAISFVVSKLDEWIVTSDELADKVDEVTSKYKDQHGELMKIKKDYDISNEDSMISRYGELSKGVDSLGQNIALTADEYAEYRDIVNTVAEQIPGLVTGYNSQGDAILSCAGNVNTLAEAYKNLVIEQNKTVLDSGEDIFKDFNNNTLEVASGREGVSATRHLDELRDALKGFNEETIKLADGTTYSGSLEEWAKNLSAIDIGRISNLLKKYGFERNTLFGGGEGWESESDFIIRAIREDSATVKKALGDAYKDINAYADDLNTFTSAYLDTEFLTDYSHMSDRMQSVINQVASSFDTNFYEQFDSIDELEKYLDSMLSAFDGLGAGEKAQFEAAFDLKTQFNGGQISYGEYVNGIQKAGNLIDGMDLAPEIKSQIKLSLGLSESDGKWAIEEYETLLNRLTSEEYNIQLSTDEAKSLLNELTASEYSVLLDLVLSGEVDLSNFDINSLRAYIEKEAKLNEALNFTIAMDVETSGLEAFNAAMAESVSGVGLTSESISVLKGRYSELASQGYDLSAMFEETANGIHLNRKAVDELEQALASQKLEETDGHLKTLKATYDELAEEINNCTDAGERASLYAEQQSIAQKINDLATLASQYEGLTSAYNAWQNAESAGSERDMYETVLSGFETMDNEISRGWIDDSSIAFLELLTGRTDLAVASTEELKKVYGQLDDAINSAGYSIRDFFTVDAEGNSTNTGVYNFLETVEALEKSTQENGALGKAFNQIENIDNLIQRDKDNNIIGFDFNVAGGDEAIAEALGISEELVQIMLRAADDAGFVVTIDGKWTQLADLKNSAETANDALNKLYETSEGKFGTDHQFNFNASSLQDLNTELESAIDVLDKFKKDGKVDLNMEGAQEALDIASYFTATIDKLTEPAYMQLETNQVEKELQEPLTKMQEFERLSKEKHQLVLTGDTEDLEEVETKMTEIAEELASFDEETKIKLGIDGLTTEEIKEKLEAGEIEIPATVDIQLEMSEDIKDMRLLMMNQLGLVSDEEVKLKIGYEIDDSVVDKLEDEEKEVVVKYIEENEEWFNSLTQEEQDIVVEIIAKNKEWFDTLSDEEKKIAIELESSGVDLSTLTDDEQKEVVIDFVAKNKEWFDSLSEEEKKIVVNLIADGTNLDSYTPEEKSAIVKYFADGGNVSNYTPEQKQAIVEYLTDSGDPDSWTPEQKEAVAKFIKDSEEVDNYTPEQKQAIAKFIKDSIEPDNYKPKDKDATVVYDKNSKEPDNYKPKDKSATVTFWATIKKVGSSLWGLLSGGSSSPRRLMFNGTANVDGTAFGNGSISSGRAFMRGDWRTKKTEEALTGELGPEIVVTRDNKWYTVGDRGAEFVTIPSGSIVFNHRQTEELFKNGKITSGSGRGRALAGGTAFSSGTGGFGKVNGNTVSVEADTVNVNSNKTTTSSGSDTKKETSSDSKEAAEEFKESIDLIEIAIDRLERTISQLDTRANSAYRSWEERNSALVEQIGKVGEEIALQEKAYERYMQEAANVGLDAEWVLKIQNGSIDIEEITDEELKEKIDEYRNWYEAALDCKDAIIELQEAESELYKQRFDNVLAQYEGMLSIIEHEKNMLDEFVAQSEAQGWLISEKYYEALIGNEQKQIAKLQEEKSALLSELQTAMQSGKIAKGSEAW